MKQMYWLKAILKSGGSKTHYCFTDKYDDVLKFAHRILEEDSEVDYCIPVHVTLEELDVEIRRRK
jgi:hypothetical protein